MHFSIDSGKCRLELDKKIKRQKKMQITQCEEDLFDGNQKNEWNLSYWINPDRGDYFLLKKLF